MGACLSCLPHRFFDNDRRRASEGNGGSRWQRRCRRFLSFSSCCGVCEALFQRAEEQDGTSAHSDPLLQSTEHSDGTSGLTSAPPAHSAYANTRNVDMLGNLLRHDKMGTNLLQAQIGETQYRNGSGSGWHREALVIDRPKAARDYDGDQRLRDKVVSKLSPPGKNEKADAVTSLLDDDDICPTCLDGYDEENPKIITKCGHHFHLACIFEWMERSKRCPLCDQEMVFSESL